MELLRLHNNICDRLVCPHLHKALQGPNEECLSDSRIHFKSYGRLRGFCSRCRFVATFKAIEMIRQTHVVVFGSLFSQ